ncbi:unnamed protein product [Protopolystoma xenopodis]|uniref:Uncharacterized protein n=1 Tax=Protopolystoma xenopodis TaxID=117903 RepID=A0A448XPJ9_9PLAT|nr:unnamed protein product [Protopolystoma xenopodis]
MEASESSTYLSIRAQSWTPRHQVVVLSPKPIDLETMLQDRNTKEWSQSSTCSSLLSSPPSTANRSNQYGLDQFPSYSAPVSIWHSAKQADAFVICLKASLTITVTCSLDSSTSEQTRNSNDTQPLNRISSSRSQSSSQDWGRSSEQNQLTVDLLLVITDEDEFEPQFVRPFQK